MGHLRYIDNVDYSGEKPEGIDGLAEEMKRVSGTDAEAYDIYTALRKAIYDEIVLDDLAITRIAPDLIAITAAAPRKALLVMHLLASPYASYSELGKRMGYSKQRAAIILHSLAQSYEWLGRLLALHND